MSLAELGVPVLAALADRIASANAPQTANIEVGGRTWRTLIAPLPLRGVPEPPRLVFAAPLDELLTEARAMARDSAATMALVLAVALVLALLAARAIARPIRALAGEADAIRRFEFSRPVAVASVVKEVDELAGTMDEMKRTIRRFLDISAAVAAEPDLDRLMPRLLDETIAAAGAQGGALYLASDDGTTLSAAAVRLAGGKAGPASLPPIPLAGKRPATRSPKPCAPARRARFRCGAATRRPPISTGCSRRSRTSARCSSSPRSPTAGASSSASSQSCAPSARASGRSWSTSSVRWRAHRRSRSRRSSSSRRRRRCSRRSSS